MQAWQLTAPLIVRLRDLFLCAVKFTGREASEPGAQEEVIPVKSWIEGFSARTTTQQVSTYAFHAIYLLGIRKFSLMAMNRDESCIYLYACMVEYW